MPTGIHTWRLSWLCIIYHDCPSGRTAVSSLASLQNLPCLSVSLWTDYGIITSFPALFFYYILHSINLFSTASSKQIVTWFSNTDSQTPSEEPEPSRWTINSAKKYLLMIPILAECVCVHVCTCTCLCVHMCRRVSMHMYVHEYEGQRW